MTENQKQNILLAYLECLETDIPSVRDLARYVLAQHEYIISEKELTEFFQELKSVIRISGSICFDARRVLIPAFELNKIDIFGGRLLELQEKN